MVKKYMALFIAALLLGAAIYKWRLANSGQYIADPEDPGLNESSEFGDTGSVVYVGDHPITRKEINWEFELHTQALGDFDDLSPLPNPQGEQSPLKTLKSQLLANLIERKLLYQYIRQNYEFDINDPNRYVSCLQKWQETVAEGNELFRNPDVKSHLKDRLCEKDIIIQYLNEVLFASIKISQKEIESYFIENKKDFEYKPKVVVRQIVLASESDAKKVRHKVNSKNFATVAKEVSIAPESENGGLLGPFTKGSMPSVFDVAFTMRKGEIRGILKSTYGFHIIMLEEKIPRRRLSLAEAAEQIEKLLREQKEKEEYQRWVELALNEVLIKSPRSL